jgi:hypothetical protein
MLTTYFKIVRKAISEKRKKGSSAYYESHHIVPQSFGKKSSEVLLTAREHYRVHKLLAETFRAHPIYGQKTLWAFHRMAYDGTRQLSESDYAEARELLMPLWKREKKEDWKKLMSEKMKGNQNGKGKKKDWVPTQEQRKNISVAATRSKLGKVGAESRASKGAVVCKNKITGEIIEAGSALQLAKRTGIHYSVFHDILNGENFTRKPKPKSKRSKYYEFLQNHEIYYKNQST